MKDSRIPAEIIGFFEGQPGKSLLIKGPPGGGKTIFAFTMLLETGRNGIYLSTRVDPESLYNQIAWLKTGLPPENIVDATLSERQKTIAGAPAIRALKYTDVPDFLKGVYLRTERMERPLVIIDSWDAVVANTGFHDPREREKLEHNLSDFSRKTATDIIFIAEYDEQKPLDYLVDGLIVMKKESYDDRRIRTITLEKLRGQPIRQPAYLVSLAGGMFRAFPTFKGWALGDLSRLPAIPDIGPGRLSTGMKDLDALIGGYTSFNLCRGDRTSYDLLLLSFILNSLSLGKPLILSPSEQSLMRNVSSAVSKEVLKKVQTLPKECFNALDGSIAQIATQNCGSSPICFLNSTELIGQGARKAAEVIAGIVEKGGFVFCFVPEGESLPDEVASMATVSLGAKMVVGVPCIYGDLPRTEILALAADGAQDSLEISLTPIV